MPELSKKRHILKTLSYRIISTSFGFIFMFLFTGSVELSSAFSLVELLWKPIQYYLHERFWYKIKYGIKK